MRTDRAQTQPREGREGANGRNFAWSRGFGAEIKRENIEKRHHNRTISLRRTQQETVVGRRREGKRCVDRGHGRWGNGRRRMQPSKYDGQDHRSDVQCEMVCGSFS